MFPGPTKHKYTYYILVYNIYKTYMTHQYTYHILVGRGLPLNYFLPQQKATNNSTLS